MRWQIIKSKGILVIIVIAAILTVNTSDFLRPLSVSIATACCFPCSSVFADDIQQKAIQWVIGNCKPYVSQLASNWAAEQAQKAIQGIYGQGTSSIDAAFKNYSPSIITSETNAVIERLKNLDGGKMRKAISNYKTIPLKNKREAMLEILQAQAGASSFATGKKVFEQMEELDNQLKKMNPNKIDFAASSGVQKDTPKLAEIHAKLLASQMQVITAREAQYAITSLP